MRHALSREGSLPPTGVGASQPSNGSRLAIGISLGVHVTFDIFHIGYPYEHVLSYLAKAFPNVYIDMCWAHAISPTACVNALVEWLDAVPANKISAFGGDYCFVDGVYGHQYLARENVSRALALKVDNGVFDCNRAVEIARMLLLENPKRIFNLSSIT